MLGSEFQILAAAAGKPDGLNDGVGGKVIALGSCS